jgi:hypothetical protein
MKVCDFSPKVALLCVPHRHQDLGGLPGAQKALMK